MKKTRVMTCLCMLIVALVACGEQYSSPETEIVSEEVKENSNPIDRDFVWEGGIASEVRISEAVEYRDLWNKEKEHTLAILKEYLMEEDYEIIQQAHESWTQYIGNAMKVEQNIFQVGMSYGVGSNDTYPLVMEAAAERTKEYAIELMALEYALTGTVEFVAGN